MKVGESLARNRGVSYGEKRRFQGLEAFAIRRRLRAARHVLDVLVANDPNGKFEVLELGCGFWGRNLSLLSKEYMNINFKGVDLSVSKNVSGVSLIEADISTWKPSQNYDAVLSLAVIEHLVDSLGHFELMAKCLRKGGFIGLTTPGPQAHFVLDALARLGIFDRSEIEDHKLYLTETGIHQLAVDSGFSVLEFKRFSLGMNQWVLMQKN